MRKLLLLIIFSGIFLSCSRNDSQKTIKFWHFWSEPNQKNALLELINKFEKENDCKVELTELSWNDGKTKLIAAFNSATAPDVVELGSDWIAQFSSSGVLKELNSDTFAINKFIDFSRQPSYWNGKLYAIPWVVDTRVMFFNRDLLTKAGRDGNPPLTMQELLEMARAVHLGNDIYGFGANGADPHRLYKKILTFFWTFGGDVFNERGELALASPQNIAALNFYKELSKVGMIETQRQLDASFVQGKIAFWISGAWLLEKIQNENPKLNFGISTIPSYENSRGISFAGGEYLAINASSKNYNLAKKLIKFLTDGQNSLQLCKKINEAGFPADKSYFKNKELVSSEYKKVFAEQLESSRMTPVHPHWLEIEEIIENAVVQVLYDRMDAYSALKEAQTQINLLLSKK